MKSLWLFFLFAATAMAQSLPMTVGMCINPSGNLIEMAGSSAMQPYHGNLPQTVVMGGAADGAYHPLQCDANGYLITGSGSGTVNSGATGQIAYYAGNGTAVSGSSNVSLQSINSFFYASQYATGGLGTSVSPWTSASGTGGIQEAVNAAVALPVVGSGFAPTVYIPTGFYTVTTPILITATVRLQGAGWASQLVSGTTSEPVILIQPTVGAEIKGFSLSDFTITANASGGCGITLDGTSNLIVWGEIRHVQIYQQGSNGICGLGSGAAQGTPVLTTVENSQIYGGISFPTAGDSISIIHNQLTGTGSNSFDTITGATGLVLKDNNITIDGGTHFGGATQVTSPKVLHNEFETFSTFTGSHGAVLDFDSLVVGGIVEGGNTFAVVNGITADSIRLGDAVGITIRGNTFERGAGASHDIIATSSSAHDNVLDNYWVNGPPYSSMFSNSGTANVFFTPSGLGPLLGNATPLTGLDTTGAVQNLVQIDNLNRVHVYAGSGNANMIAAGGGPTYLYNSFNGQISGVFAQYASGTQPNQSAQSATVFVPYNFALAQMLMTRTAPTIASGFGTGASVMQNNGTATFLIGVGTGGTATNGVIGLSQAANGWDCACQDVTTQSSSVFITKEIAYTTTSCTIANFNTTGAQAAWGATDQLSCRAFAR